MKFSINKSELQTALSAVIRGVSSRSTLPILSGILITAQDDELILQTTNLELSIKYRVPALIEAEGSTVVPGKLFNDIVKSLPDVAIQTIADDTTMEITCDSSSFTVHTLNPTDFPTFPVFSPDASITMPFSEFAPMITKVVRVASRDENRPILTGVCITATNGILDMGASDTYRLAAIEAPFDNQEADGFQAVVPGDFLNLLLAVGSGDDPIQLGVSENQVIAEYKSITMINRKIEGKYPNYRKVLPTSYLTRIEVETQPFIDALKRITVMNSSTSYVVCRFDIPDKVLYLSASSKDLGSAKDSMFCEGEGDSVEILLNSHHLIEGLSLIGEPKTYIELQGFNKQAIFKNENGDYIYMLMPVVVNDAF